MKHKHNQSGIDQSNNDQSNIETNNIERNNIEQNNIEQMLNDLPLRTPSTSLDRRIRQLLDGPSLATASVAVDSKAGLVSRYSQAASHALVGFAALLCGVLLGGWLGQLKAEHDPAQGTLAERTNAWTNVTTFDDRAVIVEKGFSLIDGKPSRVFKVRELDDSSQESRDVVVPSKEI